MLDARITLALVAAIGFAAPALAQDASNDAAAAPAASGQAAALEDLDAKRINANQIIIDFEYQGSACENVGPAEIGDLVDGTLSVTFPTISTAEVCTMQVKEIEVEQAIQAEHIISRIDVTLTAPDGKVIGTGSTDVEHD